MWFLRTLAWVLILTGALGHNLHLVGVGAAVLFLLYTVTTATRLHERRTP